MKTTLSTSVRVCKNNDLPEPVCHPRRQRRQKRLHHHSSPELMKNKQGPAGKINDNKRWRGVMKRA